MTKMFGKVFGQESLQEAEPMVCFPSPATSLLATSQQSVLEMRQCMRAGTETALRHGREGTVPSDDRHVGKSAAKRQGRSCLGSAHAGRNLT